MKNSNSITTTEQFWKDKFSYCDEVTYLTEKTTSDQQLHELSVELSSLESKTIHAWANRQGMSIYVFFLALFSLYLSRTHGNSEAFYVGFSKQEKLFPVLCAFKNEETFSSFANKIEASADASISYATVPCSYIFSLGAHDTEFDKSWFDVVVGDTAISAQKLFSENNQLHLFLEITETNEHTIRLTFHYKKELFSKREIKAIAKRLNTLCKDALDEHNIYKKLYQLHLLPDDEYQKLLTVQAGEQKDFASKDTVHGLFEKIAEQNRQKIALIAPDATLTYEELNKEANKLAHGLISFGIKKGERVAFALPRDSRAIITMLAVLKAGGAYVPLDLHYPQDRIDFILADSGAKLYITEENYSLLFSDNDKNPNVSMEARDTCYCLFTSGSTGRPKGTLLHHQGLVNLVCNLDIYKDVSDVKRIGFLTTLTFDVATQGIFTAFLNGFTGVFLPEPSRTLIKTVIDDIIDYEVDVIFSSPSYFDTLTAKLENAEKLLRQLKIVALAGEAFYLNSTVNSIRKNYPTRFENQYGPVELHVIVTTKTVESKKTISIGRPIANTYAYVVDSYNNLLPYGCVGELCFAGICVGGGYLNREELTSEKFIWNPFENPFGYGKLYKTGDLARWSEEGELEYLGRNDFLVKVRGLRVEMGEIESSLAEVPGVLQTVCVVQKDKQGAQHIVAFYTAEKPIEQSTFKEHVSKSLPSYMIPNTFVELDELPKTTSGKIDRKKLPVVSFENDRSQKSYVAPQTPLQKQLVAMVQEVLNVQNVGITDDFFSLGGDSLHAIELVSRAQDEHIHIPLQWVFDYPTIEKLEGALMEASSKTKKEGSHPDVSNLLINNTLEMPLTIPPKKDFSTAFITGGTGFFGAHLIHALIQNTSATLYCLTRDSKSHLFDTLRYYFGDVFLMRIKNRIKPIVGNLETLDSLSFKEPLDFVFHCAAQVKHYGSIEDFEATNVQGTRHVIDFCACHKAKLIHLSTVSVVGEVIENLEKDKAEELIFTEQNLYIGQSLDNLYSNTKFKAEELVLLAMKEGLIEANIVRLGNLTNRSQDLVFQPNYENNAFYLRMKAFLHLGVLPEYLANDPWEFSPVDDSAEAVVAIAKHFNTHYTVFHCYHPCAISAASIFGFLPKTVGKATFVADEEFLFQLHNVDNQKDKENLLIYLDANERLHFEEGYPIDNSFTTAYLETLGHKWSPINESYLRKYFCYFHDLGLL